MITVKEYLICFFISFLFVFIFNFLFRSSARRNIDLPDEDVFGVVMKNAMLNDAVKGEDRWTGAVDASIKQLRLKSVHSDDPAERRRLAKGIGTLEQLAEKMRLR